MSSRRLLQLILVVQALAGVALALALLWSGVIASAWAAAALAALFVLLVRMVITANNFVLTARFSSPTPDELQLGLGGGLRLYLDEFIATFTHTSWFMARARACERIYPDSGKTPVLLLHGYGCNSGYWAHLIPLLDAETISHAALDLEPMMGAIDDYVPMVQRAVQALCMKTGSPNVIIVAHSMGGLVARAYMRAHGSEQVAHGFTLGTPHHGTSLANLGVGKNAVQMRRGAQPDAPESQWLRDLAAAESAETRALITSIFTHHDNIVAPQTSSILPGARSIEFGGMGHVAMGRNTRILTRLMQEISIVFTR